MSDIDCIFMERHQSVSEFKNISEKFLTSTNSTYNYFTSQTYINVMEKIKTKTTSSVLNENLQKHSNEVLRQIFKKEPHGYWADED